MVCSGFRVVYGFWNIIWMFLCRLCRLWCLSVVMLVFLKWMVFEVGFLMLVSILVMVDLFEFDVFMRVSVFFGFRWNDMLLIVMIGFCLWCGVG